MKESIKLLIHSSLPHLSFLKKGTRNRKRETSCSYIVRIRFQTGEKASKAERRQIA